MTEIKPFQVWKHKNGDMYETIMLVNMDNERHEAYPPSVVYIRLKDLTTWCRPIMLWHDSFEFQEDA